MTHRNTLLQQLIQYVPSSIEESVSLNKITTFVSKHANCFDRELQHGHITGSAWLLNHTGDKVLLTHHCKLGIWLQLGGHADGDSDVLNVALREAIEESGIAKIEAVTEKIFDIDVHKIPANSKDPEHYHYDVRYLFRVAGDENFVVSDESHDLKWVGRSEAKSMSLDDSVRRMFRKWFK